MITLNDLNEIKCYLCEKNNFRYRNLNKLSNTDNKILSVLSVIDEYFNNNNFYHKTYYWCLIETVEPKKISIKKIFGNDLFNTLNSIIENDDYLNKFYNL